MVRSNVLSAFLPRRARPIEAGATLFAAALLVAALILPTAGAWMLDDRTINGASMWDKPLKFEMSIVIHLVTMGLIVAAMKPSTRESRATRVVAAISAISGIGEVLYITLQAARGRASHFNSETPIEIAMYSAMGVGAVALVVCAFIFGIMVARSPQEGLGQGAKIGIVLGLTLGASLTLIIAGLMSSGVVDGFGHWIGGVRSDAKALPLFGWSITGGDLRVPHFFATHLMQALPLLGLAGDRLAPRAAKSLVYVGAVVGLAIVAATFTQALLGRPLLAL